MASVARAVAAISVDGAGRAAQDRSVMRRGCSSGGVPGPGGAGSPGRVSQLPAPRALVRYPSVRSVS